MIGFSYDAAGNLLNDSTTASTYDALNRLLTTSAPGQTRTNTYNGEGVLVAQDANGVLTRYTQDLASPLSQVLQTTTGSAVTHAVYGTDRLFALSGTTRTWYAPDALASVRRTLADSGTPSAPIAYDAWGTPEGGAVPPTFGFTGELQDVGTGMVNLRARWYTPGRGTFTSRDPFEGFDQQPYSLHPYQYASSNPVLWIDPTGSRGCNPEMGVTSSPCMGGEGSSGGPGGTYPPPTRPTPPEYPDRVWTEPLPPRYPPVVPVVPVVPAVPAVPAVPGGNTIGIVITIGTIILSICTLAFINPQPVAPPQPQPSQPPVPSPTNADPCDCFNKQGMQPSLSEGASPGPNLGGWGRIHIENDHGPNSNVNGKGRFLSGTDMKLAPLQSILAQALMRRTGIWELDIRTNGNRNCSVRIDMGYPIGTFQLDPSKPRSRSLAYALYVVASPNPPSYDIITMFPVGP